MKTAPSITALARFKPAGLVLGLLLLLTAWIGFLRWPTFGATRWNVDESIHATVARTLLDGGVLYRDAVDQRRPLTYCFTAFLFRLCGEHNLRAAAALIIS